MDSMVSSSEATRPSDVRFQVKQTALALSSSLATRVTLAAGTVLAAGLALFFALASAAHPK